MEPRSSQEGLSGFVLHRRRWKEKSYWLSLFLLEQGKINAIWHPSRQQIHGGGPEPFRPYVLALTGRSELKTVVSAEEPIVPNSSFGLYRSAKDAVSKEKPTEDELRERAIRQYSALYCNELLYRLLPPGSPQPELFQCLVRTFASLFEGAHTARILREFELTLLEALGFLPDYATTLYGEPLEPASQYGFQVSEHGLAVVPFVTRSASAIQKPAAALPLPCHDGRTVMALHDRVWNAETLSLAKVLHRRLLDVLLNGRVLESRRLLQAFQRGRGAQ